MGNEMSEEDWRKFDAITDDDISVAIADDPDWQGVDLSDKLGWRVVRPDGSSIVPLFLDAKTINFINEHHVDYQSFLAGVLKAYVESQQKSNL